MENITHEELEQLKFRGEKLLVDFYAPWCGPCRVLIPNLEKLEADFPEVKFVKLNVDECGQYAMEFGIRSVPTVLFFDGHKSLGNMTGVKPMNEYIEKLNELKNYE
jgi:thioredoxin 1